MTTNVPLKQGEIESSQRVRPGSELSTHRRISASGTAPVRRATTVPPSTSRKVGMVCTPKRRASAGEVSTLTLTSFNRPDKSRATCSSAGLTIRHGPHHSAHISTSTGMAASSTISSNSSSPLSVIHGRAAPHLPHLGTPDARSGIRFFVPQVAHGTTSTRGSAISVGAPSTTVPRRRQPRATEKGFSRCLQNATSKPSLALAGRAHHPVSSWFVRGRRLIRQSVRDIAYACTRRRHPRNEPVGSIYSFSALIWSSQGASVWGATIDAT